MKGEEEEKGGKKAEEDLFKAIPVNEEEEDEEEKGGRGFPDFQQVTEGRQERIRNREIHSKKRETEIERDLK